MKVYSNMSMSSMFMAVIHACSHQFWYYGILLPYIIKLFKCAHKALLASLDLLDSGVQLVIQKWDLKDLLVSQGQLALKGLKGFLVNLELMVCMVKEQFLNKTN